MSVGLSRDRIVDAALAVIASEGSGALTMRRLASELGVQPTAIYWHIGNRRGLVDAIVERVISDLVAPEADAGDPVERLRSIGTSFRQVMRERPHLLEFLGREGRAAEVVSPLRDACLDELLAAGFDPHEAALRTRTVVFHVVGFVLVEQGMVTRGLGAERDGSADTATGVSGVPVRLEVAAAMAAFDGDTTFSFSLETLLAGLLAR